MPPSRQSGQALLGYCFRLVLGGETVGLNSSNQLAFGTCLAKAVIAIEEETGDQPIDYALVRNSDSNENAGRRRAEDVTMTERLMP